MRPTLADVDALLAPAREAWRRHAAAFPGDGPRPGPLHTVVEGAHRFHAGRVRAYGEEGLAALLSHAPSAALLAHALDLSHDDMIEEVFPLALHKLETHPIDDFRVDFEDGYGNRPDDEEDATAIAVGEALVRTGAACRLGVRIKPITAELATRAARTLDLVVTALGSTLPPGFIVTLPKCVVPEQITAFADLADALESARGLPHGALRCELMIELTQSTLDRTGRNPIPALVSAARGRCDGALIGTYDFTASAGVTAARQALDHPSTDLARFAMISALAGTGLHLSDGSNAILPVGDHDAVCASWRHSLRTIHHHLHRGLYAGWDLHPAQLPIRWIATHLFFRAAHTQTVTRLRAYLDRFVTAPDDGAILDDAATGQAMLTHLLRARAAGALSAEEIADCGLTPDELATGSFTAILAGRRAR